MDAVNVSDDCYLTVGDTKFNYIPDVAVSWTDGDVAKRKLGPLLMEPIHDDCMYLSLIKKVNLLFCGAKYAVYLCYNLILPE